MRHISLRALAVFILLLAHVAVAGMPNRVTILYDSFGKSPTLTMDWGFAALVEYGGNASCSTRATMLKSLNTTSKQRASICKRSILWLCPTATVTIWADWPICSR